MANNENVKKPKKVGWGKPDTYIKDLEAENPEWMLTPPAVEKSTQLTPTKGEKKEAKVEGGDNEDVLYNANNYDLAYQIRRTSNKTMPIKHVDGVVDHHYAVVVVPKNRTAPGPYIAESAVSVEDNFTTDDGGTDLYTHSAILPDGEERKVKWGIFTVTKDPETGKITIKASGGDFGEEEVEI